MEEIEANMIKLVVAFSAIDKKIYMRTYEVNIAGTNLFENEGKVDIEQMSPKVNLIVRRSQFADQELWKMAVKQPKPINKKHVFTWFNSVKECIERQHRR